MGLINGYNYMLSSLSYEDENIQPSVHHLQRCKELLRPLEAYLAETGMPGSMVIRIEPCNTAQDKNDSTG